MREIALRDAAERCVVLLSRSRSSCAQIFERFEGETFGVRAGTASQSADAALEGDLSKNAGWMRISRPTHATRFAPFASRKTAGSRAERVPLAQRSHPACAGRRFSL